MTKLLELLGGVEISEFRRHYEKLITERIEKDWMKREGQWTESLAVGGKEFIAQMQPLIRNRRETVAVPIEQGCWVLNEENHDRLFGGEK